MSEKKTRRRAIKQFTCPNHPDGPPEYTSGGYEADSEPYIEAIGQDVRDLIRLAATEPPGPVREAGTAAAVAVGFCCEGHTWKVVGYETVAVSPFEDFLCQSVRTNAIAPMSTHVLLAEMTGKPRVPPGDSIIVQLTPLP